MTIAELLAQATRALAPVSDTPRLDAELLLAHALDKPRIFLRTWPEREIDGQSAARFQALLLRRAAGEPVAYLLGVREFWSLELAVSPATLIPRPDTELLVEQVLALLPRDAAGTVADLGTGTGAVALAVACERPACRVIATDRSQDALDLARANATRHGLANVEFRHGDWLAPLAGERCILIASNPPYIADSDPHLAMGDVRFEPRSALAAGPDGLADIRRIAAQARAHLIAGGHLLLEHGYDQEGAVRQLLAQCGYAAIRCYRDAGGQPRVTRARWDGCKIPQSG